MNKYILSKFNIGQIILLLSFNLIALNSCKKFATVSPPVTSLTSTNVFTNDASAAAVLTGIYDKMSAGSFATGSNSLSLEIGLSSDELKLSPNVTSPAYQGLYRNSLSSVNNAVFWSELYSYIHTSNLSIEGISASTSLTPSVKQQLLGEAKFTRAFFYFYLVNLFGDVPLITSSNYEINSILPRAPKSEIYLQIITDLKDAQALLSSNYLSSNLQTITTEKVRPTKWAATALLARTYLFLGDYANANTQASAVINSTASFTLSSLNNVFLKNSSEAIWQLMPVQPAFNTLDGSVFILTTAPGLANPATISGNLLNAFEINDARMITWIKSFTSSGNTYYFPFKYKVKTGSVLSEYLMALRLSEQYLIRAEAEAQQNDIVNAAADLNIIRNRAGLPNTTASTQVGLLTAILHERQVELFSEWGHRWFDLIRTGTANSVLGSPGNVCQSKGGVWNSNWQLFPIPLSDLQTDSKLTQNPGY